VAPPAGWLVTGLAFAAVILSTVRTMRQWGPDSRYYLGWAYRYAGFDEAEAGRRTYEFLSSWSWFGPFCHGACGADVDPSAYDQLFHGATGGLVAPRVMYPLLSAPFVRLFGPWGMLVVPLLAYAVAVVAVMVVAARLAGRQWSVVAALGMILPVTVSRFATYAYTEALTIAISAACLLVLPLGRQARRRDVAVFASLLAVFAFTRQFHLVVVAAVTMAWFATLVARRRVRNEWLPFVLAGVAVTAVAGAIQAATAPAYSIVDSFLRHSGAGDWSGVPAAVARVAWRLVRAELFDILRDVPLAVLCLLAAVALAYRWRHPVSHLAAGALGGTAVLHILNTEPSHFRYYTTAVPLLAIAVAVLLSGLFTAPPAQTAGPEKPGEPVPIPREPTHDSLDVTSRP
jgi:hypothetical protein